MTQEEKNSAKKQSYIHKTCTLLLSRLVLQQVLVQIVCRQQEQNSGQTVTKSWILNLSITMITTSCWYMWRLQAQAVISSKSSSIMHSSTLSLQFSIVIIALVLSYTLLPCVSSHSWIEKITLLSDCESFISEPDYAHGNSSPCKMILNMNKVLTYLQYVAQISAFQI